MGSRPKGVLAALAAVVVTACLGSLDVEPRATDFSLSVATASPTAGSEVTFEYAGEGASIQRVVLEYGDGAADTVGAFGSQTIAGRLEHAYGTAGTFDVRGRLEDSAGGRAEDGLTLVVASAGPSAAR